VPNDNSHAAIDLRIDTMLQAVDPPEPHRVLIDRVYRPFVKILAAWEEQNIEADAAIQAALSLLANLIRETAVSTSDDPPRMRALMLLHLHMILDAHEGADDEQGTGRLVSTH
jgi:hypothetical protein